MGFLKNKKKLLIIGLDGVPYDMIGKFSDCSLMPNIKRIFASGKLVKMEVGLPEISSVSWSSFMTGTDPGKHGIFGFTDIENGTYEYRFPDFRDLQAPTFFDELGEKKKRSVIINLPSTYPAREIPGVLISGFVAIDLKKAVYPLTYLPFLKNSGYMIDIDARKGKEKKSEFISDLHTSLKTRKKAADFFWEKEKWDVFMFTITGTDRLHHFLFDAYADETHRYHDEFLKYYEEIDNLIGDFFSKIPGGGEFETIILSDHGFGPIQNEVYLTPILKKHGFYDAEPGEGKSLETITGNARAFALEPSRIFIHQKGKYPRGSVDREDYDTIREEIKQLFEEYKINSRKVIKKVYFKEEIYSSRFLDRAADIVLLSNPGFDLKVGLTKKAEYGSSHFTGMHLRDNAFFFTSKPELLPEKMTIFSVKDIIFQSLNLDPPSSNR
ncbi:MAG: alkaline phosphatase family protein [Candidatus Aminicenantes bacterium]|nr:alkaline phosphatase family protein [Candidatus Aminicenantes bacterium]